MSAYDRAVGGALKLKGVGPLVAKKESKKKKEKRAAETAAAVAAEAAEARGLPPATCSAPRQPTSRNAPPYYERVAFESEFALRTLLTPFIAAGRRGGWHRRRRGVEAQQEL